MYECGNDGEYYSLYTDLAPGAQAVLRVLPVQPQQAAVQQPIAHLPAAAAGLLWLEQHPLPLPSEPLSPRHQLALLQSTIWPHREWPL
jgi:hypothetical protein